MITYLSPGMRFFHQGQLEGRKKRISPHLGRGPDEPVDGKLKEFYEKLLAVLRRPVVRSGEWRLLECMPAWEGNWTFDCFIAFAWQGPDGERLLVTVNYAPNQSQCYVRLPFADLGNGLLAAEGSPGRCRLRSRGERPAVTRAVPGCALLECGRILPAGDRLVTRRQPAARR